MMKLPAWLKKSRSEYKGEAIQCDRQGWFLLRSVDCALDEDEWACLESILAKVWKENFGTIEDDDWIHVIVDALVAMGENLGNKEMLELGTWIVAYCRDNNNLMFHLQNPVPHAFTRFSFKNGPNSEYEFVACFIQVYQHRKRLTETEGEDDVISPKVEVSEKSSPVSTESMSRCEKFALGIGQKRAPADDGNLSPLKHMELKKRKVSKAKRKTSRPVAHPSYERKDTKKRKAVRFADENIGISGDETQDSRLADDETSGIMNLDPLLSSDEKSGFMEHDSSLNFDENQSVDQDTLLTAGDQSMILNESLITENKNALSEDSLTVTQELGLMHQNEIFDQQKGFNEGSFKKKFAEDKETRIEGETNSVDSEKQEVSKSQSNLYQAQKDEHKLDELHSTVYQNSENDAKFENVGSVEINRSNSLGGKREIPGLVLTQPKKEGLDCCETIKIESNTHGISESPLPSRQLEITEVPESPISRGTAFAVNLALSGASKVSSPSSQSLLSARAKKLLGIPMVVMDKNRKSE